MFRMQFESHSDTIRQKTKAIRSRSEGHLETIRTRLRDHWHRSEAIRTTFRGRSGAFQRPFRRVRRPFGHHSEGIGSHSETTSNQAKFSGRTAFRGTTTGVLTEKYFFLLNWNWFIFEPRHQFTRPEHPTIPWVNVKIRGSDVRLFFVKWYPRDRLFGKDSKRPIIKIIWV